MADVPTGLLTGSFTVEVTHAYRDAVDAAVADWYASRKVGSYEEPIVKLIDYPDTYRIVMMITVGKHNTSKNNWNDFPRIIAAIVRFFPLANKNFRLYAISALDGNNGRPNTLTWIEVDYSTRTSTFLVEVPA